MKVPFIHPRLRITDLLRMLKSINSTWLVYGRYTNRFESVLSEYLGGTNVVATSSCTSALQLALHLSNVGPGDEVITTPISWVATSNVIIHSGATPVFVDIDPKTGLINEDLIEARITPSTKAVLFVDLFGQLPNLIKIREICNKYKIFMIEDAAHALESDRDGYQPGQISDFAAFSFHSAKNITSGQGGALTTRSEENSSRAKILRRDGVINLPDGKRRMVELGFKFDSTDFQSALLIGQLSRIEGKLKQRRRVHDRYLKKIDSEFAQVIPAASNYKLSNHLTVILVATEFRDEIRKMLLEKGIQTSVHYESINLEPYYVKTFGDTIGCLPNAETFGKSVISLPTYPNLSRRKQNFVIKNLNQVLREKSHK